MDTVAELLTDADASWLRTLAESDRARLVFPAGRGTPPSATTSFMRDIAPLFRWIAEGHPD